MIEESNIQAWVEQAEPELLSFRQAIHVVLLAIAHDEYLKANMIIKGGILLALRHKSPRYTKDIDFSTEYEFSITEQDRLRKKLEKNLASVSEELPYGLSCKLQSIKKLPRNQPDASFPSLKITIGYAYKGSNEHKRLLNNNSPSIISIDYSYNEEIPNVEAFEISDDQTILSYSFSDLIAEKLRSLLQQTQRHRYRRQDIYDITYLLRSQTMLTQHDKEIIFNSLISKSKSRNIIPTLESLDNPDVKYRAQRDYPTLKDELTEDLPNFESSYQTVNNFYKSLPW